MGTAELVEGKDYERFCICGRFINFAYAINTFEVACATKVDGENWILFAGEGDYKSLIKDNPDMMKVIEFVFYHEIGHVLYDHIENNKSGEHRIDYTIEAQADAYACYVLNMGIEEYIQMEETYSFGCTPESIEVVKTEVERMKREEW